MIQMNAYVLFQVNKSAHKVLALVAPMIIARVLKLIFTTQRIINANADQTLSLTVVAIASSALV